MLTASGNVDALSFPNRAIVPKCKPLNIYNCLFTFECLEIIVVVVSRLIVKLSLFNETLIMNCLTLIVISSRDQPLFLD
jgi:hypothetical protein